MASSPWMFTFCQSLSLVVRRPCQEGFGCQRSCHKTVNLVPFKRQIPQHHVDASGQRKAGQRRSVHQ